MERPACDRTASNDLDADATDGAIRRQRFCTECEERLSTYEQVRRTVVMVVKKDGRREVFQREKLLKSLRVATCKRSLPMGTVETIVDDIQQHLRGSSHNEVPSRLIGEMALTRLRSLDALAYLRFASVYYQFVSLEQMFDELQRVARSLSPAPPAQARLFDDEFSELFTPRVATPVNVLDDEVEDERHERFDLDRSSIGARRLILQPN